MEIMRSVLVCLSVLHDKMEFYNIALATFADESSSSLIGETATASATKRTLSSSNEVSDFFTELKKLEMSCAAADRTVINVPSDGNCMFSAIAIQLGRQPAAAAANEIRAEIVSYIRSHPNIVLI